MDLVLGFRKTFCFIGLLLLIGNVHGQGGGVAIGMGMGGDFMVDTAFGELPNPLLSMATHDGVDPTLADQTGSVNTAPQSGGRINSPSFSTSGSGSHTALPVDASRIVGVAKGQTIYLPGLLGSQLLSGTPIVLPVHVNTPSTADPSAQYVLRNEEFTALGNIGHSIRVPSSGSTSTIDATGTHTNTAIHNTVGPDGTITIDPNDIIGIADMSQIGVDGNPTFFNFNPGTGHTSEISVLQSGMLGAPVDMSRLLPPPFDMHHSPIISGPFANTNTDFTPQSGSTADITSVDVVSMDNNAALATATDQNKNSNSHINSNTATHSIGLNSAAEGLNRIDVGMINTNEGAMFSSVNPQTSMLDTSGNYMFDTGITTGGVDQRAMLNNNVQSNTGSITGTGRNMNDQSMWNTNEQSMFDTGVSAVDTSISNTFEKQQFGTGVNTGNVGSGISNTFQHTQFGTVINKGNIDSGIPNTFEQTQFGTGINTGNVDSGISNTFEQTQFGTGINTGNVDSGIPNTFEQTQFGTGVNTGIIDSGISNTFQRKQFGTGINTGNVDSGIPNTFEQTQFGTGINTGNVDSGIPNTFEQTQFGTGVNTGIIDTSISNTFERKQFGTGINTGNVDSGIPNTFEQTQFGTGVNTGIIDSGISNTFERKQFGTGINTGNVDSGIPNTFEQTQFGTGVNTGNVDSGVSNTFERKQFGTVINKGNIDSGIPNTFEQTQFGTVINTGNVDSGISNTFEQTQFGTGVNTGIIDSGISNTFERKQFGTGINTGNVDSGIPNTFEQTQFGTGINTGNVDSGIPNTFEQTQFGTGVNTGIIDSGISNSFERKQFGTGINTGNVDSGIPNTFEQTQFGTGVNTGIIDSGISNTFERKQFGTGINTGNVDSGIPNTFEQTQFGTGLNTGNVDSGISNTFERKQFGTVINTGNVDSGISNTFEQTQFGTGVNKGNIDSGVPNTFEQTQFGTGVNTGNVDSGISNTFEQTQFGTGINKGNIDSGMPNTFEQTQFGTGVNTGNVGSGISNTFEQTQFGTVIKKGNIDSGIPNTFEQTQFGTGVNTGNVDSGIPNTFEQTQFGTGVNTGIIDSGISNIFVRKQFGTGINTGNVDSGIPNTIEHTQLGTGVNTGNIDSGLLNRTEQTHFETAVNKVNIDTSISNTFEKTQFGTAVNKGNIGSGFSNTFEQTQLGTAVNKGNRDTGLSNTFEQPQLVTGVNTGNIDTSLSNANKQSMPITGVNTGYIDKRLSNTHEQSMFEHVSSTENIDQNKLSNEKSLILSEINAAIADQNRFNTEMNTALTSQSTANVNEPIVLNAEMKTVNQLAVNTNEQTMFNTEMSSGVLGGISLSNEYPMINTEVNAENNISNRDNRLSTEQANMNSLVTKQNIQNTDKISNTFAIDTNQPLAANEQVMLNVGTTIENKQTQPTTSSHSIGGMFGVIDTRPDTHNIEPINKLSNINTETSTGIVVGGGVHAFDTSNTAATNTLATSGTTKPIANTGSQADSFHTNGVDSGIAVVPIHNTGGRTTRILGVVEGTDNTAYQNNEQLATSLTNSIATNIDSSSLTATQRVHSQSRMTGQYLPQPGMTGQYVPHVSDLSTEGIYPFEGSISAMDATLSEGAPAILDMNSVLLGHEPLHLEPTMTLTGEVVTGSKTGTFAVPNDKNNIIASSQHVSVGSSTSAGQSTDKGISDAAPDTSIVSTNANDIMNVAFARSEHIATVDAMATDIAIDKEKPYVGVENTNINAIESRNPSTGGSGIAISLIDVNAVRRNKVANMTKENTPQMTYRLGALNEGEQRVIDASKFSLNSLTDRKIGLLGVGNINTGINKSNTFGATESNRINNKNTTITDGVVVAMTGFSGAPITNMVGILPRKSTSGTAVSPGQSFKSLSTSSTHEFTSTQEFSVSASDNNRRPSGSFVIGAGQPNSRIITTGGVDYSSVPSSFGTVGGVVIGQNPNIAGISLPLNAFRSNDRLTQERQQTRVKSIKPVKVDMSSFIPPPYPVPKSSSANTLQDQMTYRQGTTSDIVRHAALPNSRKQATTVNNQIASNYGSTFAQINKNINSQISSNHDMSTNRRVSSTGTSLPINRRSSSIVATDEHFGMPAVSRMGLEIPSNIIDQAIFTDLAKDANTKRGINSVAAALDIHSNTKHVADNPAVKPVASIPIVGTIFGTAERSNMLTQRFLEQSGITREPAVDFMTTFLKNAKPTRTLARDNTNVHIIPLGSDTSIINRNTHKRTNVGSQTDAKTVDQYGVADIYTRKQQLNPIQWQQLMAKISYKPDTGISLQTVNNMPKNTKIDQSLQNLDYRTQITNTGHNVQNVDYMIQNTNTGHGVQNINYRTQNVLGASETKPLNDNMFMTDRSARFSSNAVQSGNIFRPNTNTQATSGKRIRSSILFEAPGMTGHKSVTVQNYNPNIVEQQASLNTAKSSMALQENVGKQQLQEFIGAQTTAKRTSDFANIFRQNTQSGTEGVPIRGDLLNRQHQAATAVSANGKQAIKQSRLGESAQKIQNDMTTFTLGRSILISDGVIPELIGPNSLRTLPIDTTNLQQFPTTGMRLGQPAVIKRVGALGSQPVNDALSTSSQSKSTATATLTSTGDVTRQGIHRVGIPRQNFGTSNQNLGIVTSNDLHKGVVVSNGVTGGFQPSQQHLGVAASGDFRRGLMVDRNAFQSSNTGISNQNAIQNIGIGVRNVMANTAISSSSDTATILGLNKVLNKKPMEATLFTSGSRFAVFGPAHDVNGRAVGSRQAKPIPARRMGVLGPIHDCRYKPDPQSEYYFIYKNGITQHRFRCALGTAFDEMTCECSIRVSDHGDCLEVHMDFNNGVVEDSSLNNLPIGNENVEITNSTSPIAGLALFGGDGKLTIWRYQNYDFRDHVMLKTQFRPGVGGDRYQPLISNCDGSATGPSLAIVYDNTMQEVLLLLQTVNDTRKELRFKINPDEWNDVTYIYDGQEFIGIVNGVRRYVSRENPHLLGIIGGEIKSTPTHGLVEIRDAAVVLGHCPMYGHFRGAMVDIQIYTCIPKDFRLE